MTAQRDRTGLGIALMVAFSVTGPMIDVFGKLAGAAIPVGEIVLARFGMQSALLLPLALVLGRLHRPAQAEIVLHLGRAALILLATGLFFSALRFMPIADAMAIFFVEPLLLTLLGGALLGEPVGWRRITACVIGFLGALLVIQPKFSELGLISALPLGTALFFAFYMILTRRMARGMSPVTLQAYTGVAAVAIMAPILWAFDGSGIGPLDPVLPEARFAIYLLGVGVAATVAHVFISFALSLAPAATLAPLQYLEIVGATALGFLVFGDFPDWLTLAGVAVIVGSGIYVFVRERALASPPAEPGAKLPRAPTP